MTDKDTETNSGARNVSDILKGWVMVALTLIFVLLYVAALFGWLKPLTDISMITRLEPIIFVIIGYYFGRLPAQQNEKSLKEEIIRQMQKADAAQNAKEQSRQDREALEEKIKNTKAVLTTGKTAEISGKRTANEFDSINGTESIKHLLNAAINVLDS